MKSNSKLDLCTTGPSLNFLSSTSNIFPKVKRVRNLPPLPSPLQQSAKLEQQQQQLESSNLQQINRSSSGGPKYNTFNRSTSFNRSGRNLTSLSLGCTTLVAFFEGKGSNRGQIGMAAMDIRHSELTLCQFMDTNSYTLLRIRLSLNDPIEVLLPEENEKVPSRVILLDMLRTTCPKANITTLQRRYFNDSLGIDLVKKLNVEECSNVDASVYQKYYCMGAVAALIKYVEYIQNILYAHNTLKVIYEAIEDSCLIDVHSWDSLDLIHLDAVPRKGNPNSLFEILNCCLTSGGMRTMRSYLLQPSASPDIINSRLDIVQELVKNQAMCDRIRSILANLHDLQQLVSLITYTNFGQNAGREDSKRVIRLKISQVIELKHLLEAVQKLSDIVGRCNNPFFVQNKARLDDNRLEAIAEFVNDKVSPELSAGGSRKRKGLAGAAKDQVLFAVAENQHVLLDLARRTYQEMVARIIEYGNEQHSELPGAVLCYSQSRGYHFSLHTADPYAITLPAQCIQVVFNKASITFTTRDLIKWNDRLMQSENEILQKSNLVLDQLIASIREYTTPHWLAIRAECVQGRHPILDYRKDVVPNNTYASRDESRFSVIAGPNMAGKSTYMRQVCMIQILAQMGCMVPAESASMVPMTRIFSRIGHNDDLVQNLSGFAVEMSEMAVILQNANASSLIIIDELARSTSTEEGIGVCYAICEKLLATGAFVLFATHFLDLAQLALNYPRIVKNYHFSSVTSVDPATGLVVQTPSPNLLEGPYEGPLYGLELAELTTLPEKIIKEARELAERMRKAKETSISSISISLNCTLQQTIVVVGNVENADGKTAISPNRSICAADDGEDEGSKDRPTKAGD